MTDAPGKDEALVALWSMARTAGERINHEIEQSSKPDATRGEIIGRMKRIESWLEGIKHKVTDLKNAAERP
jgi:hypothetical protein